MLKLQKHLTVFKRLLRRVVNNVLFIYDALHFNWNSPNNCLCFFIGLCFQLGRHCNHYLDRFLPMAYRRRGWGWRVGLGDTGLLCPLICYKTPFYLCVSGHIVNNTAFSFGLWPSPLNKSWVRHLFLYIDQQFEGKSYNGYCHQLTRCSLSFVRITKIL